jgi:hypothetical protein
VGTHRHPAVAAMSAERGLVLNGTAELLREGVRALEALEGQLAGLVPIEADDEPDLAEIRIYENSPITAVVTNDFGWTEIVWSGERWVQRTS